MEQPNSGGVEGWASLPEGSKVRVVFPSTSREIPPVLVPGIGMDLIGSTPPPLYVDIATAIHISNSAPDAGITIF